MTREEFARQLRILTWRQHWPPAIPSGWWTRDLDVGTLSDEQVIFYYSHCLCGVALWTPGQLRMALSMFGAAAEVLDHLYSRTAHRHSL